MKYNAQQLALIAAGASAEAVLAAATVEASPDLTPEQIAAAKLAEDADKAAAEAKAVTDAKIAADAAAADLATAAAAAKVTEPNPLVAHLTAQLATTNDALLAAKLEAASFKSAADAQDGLLAIARASLGNMYIAFNGQAATAETFSATTIVAEHARMTTQFKDKFRPGGVAQPAKPETKPVEPLAAAMSQFHIPA